MTERTIVPDCNPGGPEGPSVVRIHLPPPIRQASVAQRKSAGLRSRRARVRIPPGAPHMRSDASVAQRKSGGLLHRRPWVRIPAGAPSAGVWHRPPDVQAPAAGPGGVYDVGVRRLCPLWGAYAVSVSPV